MAEKKTYGNVKSVTVKEDGTAYIVLRTPAGHITLKLTNDTPQGHADQASVVSNAVSWGNLANPGDLPHLNVTYDDGTFELKECTLTWLPTIVWIPGGLQL